jgi:hypothetical protein
MSFERKKEESEARRDGRQEPRAGKSSAEGKTERPMTLVTLLGLNESWLGRGTAASMRYFERAWVEAGRPTEPEELARFLDQAIDFCRDNELRYPRYVLGQLRRLKRGEWFPGLRTAP